MSDTPIEFRNFPPGMTPRFGPYRAVVSRVVDGDTFYALIDFGFNKYDIERIRLLGVDAPEKNRAATKVAGIAAWRFVQELLPPGSPLILDTEPDKDDFGRYLAHVQMEDGRDLGLVLVNAGHAVVAT